MTPTHRILVCGVGAVGERHIGNLLALGYTQIAVFRRRGWPLRTLSVKLPVYDDLATALANFGPTVALVTNPTAYHIPVALEAARAGCHLLIEKPVSHTLHGLDALQTELAAHGRCAMVGYMLRFHPLLRQVKAWLGEGAEGTLGRPLFARASWGEHVPDWHPWEDYRQSYAVRPDLGGGPALTLSHELDVLVWMLGRAQRVIGMPATHTPLQIACEHTIDMLIRFESGATANVHLDYCQRPPHRSWELTCTRGRVVFDYFSGTLTRWDGVVGEIPTPAGMRTPSAEVLRVPDDFDRNDLFREELRYFFGCLEAGQSPTPGLDEAAESVHMALSALHGDSQ
jgi:predicted dehydrogenase